MMIGLNIVFLWSSRNYLRWVENLPGTERRGHREPWNKGKLVGQKAPLRLKEIWAIRIRLQLGAHYAHRTAASVHAWLHRRGG